MLGCEKGRGKAEGLFLERPLGDLTGFKKTGQLLVDIEMTFGEQEAVARALLPDDAEPFLMLLRALTIRTSSAEV